MGGGIDEKSCERFEFLLHIHADTQKKDGTKNPLEESGQEDLQKKKVEE